MKRFSPLTLLVFVLFIFVSFISLVQAQELGTDARIHKKFKLLPGKSKDRYVVYIPFQVTKPGRIHVYHEMTGVDLKVDGIAALPNYHLVDARIFDKIDDDLWDKIRKEAIKAMLYHPTVKLVDEGRKFVEGLLGKDDKPKWFHGSQDLLKKKSHPLVHDVDDRDLLTTKGRYLVILRNPSPGEYHGNILISFPGDVWDVDPDLEAASERKPDLAIKNIDLDVDNHVVVTVENLGPGWLYKVRYNREGERVIRLNVEVNGKKVASLPIADVDPKYALVTKGSPVTYRTDIQIKEPSRVMAFIDADNVVAEPNKGNNQKRVTLTPKVVSTEPGKRVKRSSDRGTEEKSEEKSGSVQSESGMPDLVATDIFLTNRKQIAVKIENKGAGIPAEFYRANPQPHIHLLMNGRSWSYVPLAFLDPAGALKQSGGSAVWTSDYTVREAVEITAIVDEGDRIPETNENNNTFTRLLSP